MVLLPLTSSKTAPKPEGPPDYVVPKRLPLLSATRPPTGALPLLPLKLASVVMELALWTNSQTVPPPPGPPPSGGARVLVNPRPRVQNVIDTLNFYKMIPVFPSLEVAQDSLTTAVLQEFRPGPGR